MKDIAVLMTVHNRKDKTLDCLHCLFLEEGLGDSFSVKVYLTDDGCTDGTADAVRQLYPQVIIIPGNGELYWNRGMYAAWQEAAKVPHDFFLWLNDDTYLFPDCLMNLLAVAYDKPGNIVLGATCDSATRSITTYGGQDQKGNMIFDAAHCSECRYMNGNIVLIPKEVFQIIGLNDPYYRHSTGDTDYGLMAWKQGIKLILVPGHQGICDLHPSSPVWSNPDYPLKDRWIAMMKPTGANPFEYFHFRKKHFGTLAAYATFISNICHLLLPSLWKR